MIRTADGKWVLFEVATGQQREFWSVDARPLLAAGTHVLDPPDGVTAVAPPMPPESVQVLPPPVVTHPEGEPPTRRGRSKAAE